jgi:hypothetical protein
MNGLESRYPSHDNGARTLGTNKETENSSPGTTVKVHERFQRENQTFPAAENTPGNPMNGIKWHRTLSLENPRANPMNGLKRLPPSRENGPKMRAPANLAEWTNRDLTETFHPGNHSKTDLGNTLGKMTNGLKSRWTKQDNGSKTHVPGNSIEIAIQNLTAKIDDQSPRPPFSVHRNTQIPSTATPNPKTTIPSPKPHPPKPHPRKNCPKAPQRHGNSSRAK